MTRLLPLPLAVTGPALAVAAARSNLIINPGFETGDFTGWTQSGDTGFTFVNAARPAVHSGGYGALLGPSGVGFLEQSFTTAPNAVLAIGFWLKNLSISRNFFSVILNGTELFSLSNAAAFDYTEYRFVVTGSASGCNTLTFASRHGIAYFALDAVFVTAAPVPAPALMAPLDAGLLGRAAVRRRREAEAEAA
ncbi:hypothetical protein [Elioraea sp.]|uniref:hypothetical protein n=1 Tax=Elioraea sp. TaxID=2185103 RepID=UPI003F6EA532